MVFLIFISGNKPSLSSDVENAIEVSPPSSSPSQQTATPTGAVPSSSLSQTSGWTQAALKPNVPENRMISGADAEILKRGDALCRPPWLTRGKKIGFRRNIRTISFWQ